ncbi:MAG: hypothetical protein Q4P14_04235 [Methanobacteriaceae archaeon]|nr:hypothetical protein [Methanobacteriaceae archaeon]
MKVEEFGNNIDESALFLMDSLHTLHRGHDDVSKELAIKMIPHYKKHIHENTNIEEFLRIIDFSSILSEYHVKMVFMDELLEIPLINDDRYYSLEERIDFLINSVGENKLVKLQKNTYLFFNH